MLQTSPLVAFTATKNAALALPFYRDVLGLRLIEDGHFALVFDANGTTLRVQKFEGHVPLKSTTLGWTVRDIRTTIDGLEGKGVKFEHYPGMQQDERGIWSSPAGADVAWFKDPDGNTLSLTQWKD